MTPIIAVVGRPNVGKSTLFNRLAGKKLAIVHDLPGVTRDRHYADAHIQGRDVLIVDTGGFDPEDEDPMRQGIARHVRAAIEEADIVLCVLDTLTPPTEADRQAVDLLRRSGKPVVYFGNRSDNAASDLEAAELYALGIDPLIVGSALHGRSRNRGPQGRSARQAQRR
jgi:GTP-binding protein